jgi:hypothetical protein
MNSIAKNMRAQVGLAALAWLGACTSDAALGDTKRNPILTTAYAGTGAGSVGQGPIGAGGTGASVALGGAGSRGVTINAGTGAAAPRTGADGVPCDVAKIVGANCVGCHGAQLKYGAPMALSTLQDFKAPSKSNAQRAVYQVAYDRVMAQDTQVRMPPVSKPAVPAPDLTTLSSWLRAGAQSSPNSCPIQEPTGTDSTVIPGMEGSGGASTHPIEYNDPNLQCYKFTAYTSGQRDKKFTVPTTPDAYFNFIMKAPWQGTKYVRSLKAANDNINVIHHWIFFKNTGAPAESVASSVGAHPNAIRLYGWSPGADDVYLDPDVGIKAESDVSYTLEAHYNNTTGAPVEDGSGVEVCVTSTVPKHEALQAWVGTDTINGTTATGNCTPTNKEPIHVIAAHPHMHKKGQHMKVVLTRADGTQEVVHDEPFSFDYQRVYLKNFVINPGDSLATTCTWSMPATFGTSTNSEMCYFFPVYWPAGALVGGSAVWASLHGPNTCIN